MIKTITEYDFIDSFSHRKEDFSYKALMALFEYLEQYEESTVEQIELDPIAICCDFNEYEDMKEFQNDYGEEYESIADIENATTCIPIAGTDSFIIQAF